MLDYFTDDYQMPLEEEQEGFVINNDDLADWALRKIGERDAECERIISIARKQIEHLEEQIDEEEKKRDRETSFLKSKLNEYFMTVSHAETATMEKYKLLSGTLVLRKRKLKPVYDESDLIEYLKKNGLAEQYVKTTEKAAWGEFKKSLDFSTGEAMVKDTGEILMFIQMDEVPADFSVEVK